MTYYREKYGYEENRYVNAAAISDRIVALPVGPHLGLAEMDYITESIKQAWSEMNV